VDRLKEYMKVDERDEREKIMRKKLEQAKQQSEVESIIKPVGMDAAGHKYLEQVFSVGFTYGVNAAIEEIIQEIKKNKQIQSEETMFG